MIKTYVYSCLLNTKFNNYLAKDPKIINFFLLQTYFYNFINILEMIGDKIWKIIQNTVLPH